MPDEPLDALLRVTQTLEALNIPYFVGDSFATTAYGVIRTTLDADIIADLKVEDVEQLVGSLADAFYADAEMMRDAVQHGSTFNLIHLATMFKIDVFTSKQDAFTISEFARLVRRPLSGEPETTVNLASPEDIILAKLVWFRNGNEISERQWHDVLGVIRVQSDELDTDYLERWADRLDIRNLLDRAFEVGSHT